jgi:tRNA-specific 2-thiouridylase
VKGERIVVAMSGGVDSSVAAALLLKQGYDCVGVTMRTYRESATPAGSKVAGCCSVLEVRDAQKVAAELGIPHYVVNYEEVFKTHVIDNFLDEYVAGRTPNPCVLCNQLIKFDVLREFAGRMGAGRVASGHYARITCDAGIGRYRLWKGRDPHKDQSYVLYSLTQEQLAHTLFPLSEVSKTQTRQVAHQLGLHLAGKHESFEVCFVPDGNYRRFITERRPQADRPGPVRHVNGEVLGEHHGVAFYTVGQRRGLGIAAADPLYVVRIDRAANTLWVGGSEDLLKSRFVAIRPHWIPFDRLEAPLQAQARIRYNAPESPARVEPVDEHSIEVELLSPQRAVAPGQAVVFYQGDEVIGGATIDNVLQ